MYLKNILSHCVACLLILFSLPFKEKAFSILTKSSLSTISFTDHALVYLKGNHHNDCRLDFLLSSFGSFIVFHFTCVVAIHFQFIFVKGVKSTSRFIFCMYLSCCSSTICRKDDLFSIVLPVFLCQRSVH